MSSENVELVRRFHELARGPSWEQLELLAEDFIYRPIAEITETGEFHGRGGFRHYMEQFFESEWAEGLAAEPTSLRDYGDRVIARMQFAGHGRASGLDFTARVFIVHTVRDGMIVRMEDFVDRAAALAAAGASENVERVRQGYELWNSGDIEAWLGILDPDVVTVFAAGPDASVWHGRDAVREWHAQGLETWDGWGVMDVERYVDLGERVLVAVRWRVRGRGSGVEVESRQAHVATLRDGLVTRLEFHESEAAARAALGI